RGRAVTGRRRLVVLVILVHAGPGAVGTRSRLSVRNERHSEELRRKDQCHPSRLPHGFRSLFTPPCRRPRVRGLAPARIARSTFPETVLARTVGVLPPPFATRLACSTSAPECGPESAPVTRVKPWAPGRTEVP